MRGWKKKNKKTIEQLRIEMQARKYNIKNRAEKKKVMQNRPSKMQIQNDVHHRKAK